MADFVLKLDDIVLFILGLPRKWACDDRTYIRSGRISNISFDAKTTNFKCLSYYLAFVSVPNVFLTKVIVKKAAFLTTRKLELACMNRLQWSKLI